MIYPITIIGHPTLRVKTKSITKDYPELDTIINSMYETMYAAEGVGLAAPQVNKRIRLIVIDGSPMAEDDPEVKDFKKVIINPTIIERSGSPSFFNEGCLSIPGIREEIERPSTIKIKYKDENFDLHEETLTGTKARIIQHEFDHLEGILFTDRVSAIRKKMLKGKLVGLSKGKFSANYRTVLAK